MEASESGTKELTPSKSLIRWKPVSRIGHGFTSEVFLVENTETKKKAAIKYFHPCVKSVFARAEAQILMSLKHRRIISAVDFFPKLSLEGDGSDQKGDRCGIVLEYAPHGSLISLLNNLTELREKIARTYFHQLLDAVEYMHSHSICHLDLKPDNILLDRNFGLKIADFGVALAIPKGFLLKQAAGTSAYYPPEIHQNEYYDGFGADLFALGIIAFMMVGGNFPFRLANRYDRFYQLLICQRYKEFWQTHENLRENKIKSYTDSFKDLIQKMLAQDPKSRLDIQQIKSHEWYQGSVLSDTELKFLVKSELKNKQREVDKKPAVWLDTFLVNDLSLLLSKTKEYLKKKW